MKSQNESILTSPEAPTNGDFTVGQNASIKSVEQREGKTPAPVQNRTDYQGAVDPTTGGVSEEDAPQDPSTKAQQPGIGPTNQQTGNTTAGQQSTQSTPPAAPVNKAPEEILTPASDFEGKRRSFFNPDTKDGFFDTLDKKVQEALRGNSPDEIAQNMFFAALSMIFDMIANACDNDRKEFQRLKEEYLKNVAENDKSKGVKQVHRNLMFWAVVAAHPSMQQYIGQPIDKKVKKAALNLIKTDKEVNKAFTSIVSAACGREIKDNEIEAFIDKAGSVKAGNNTLGDIKNRALNDEVVKRGVNLAGSKGDLSLLHQKWAQQAAEVQAHNARRASLVKRRKPQSRGNFQGRGLGQGHTI